jgi:hypothetical protein
MEHLRELLAVDGRQALAFFVLGLQDVCESGVNREELLYNASVSRTARRPPHRRLTSYRPRPRSATSSITLCSTPR